MKNIYILIIIIAQTCCLFADDNSARRYAALDHDMVTCKCFLLSTKQVQDSLKLTQQQIKSLESAWWSSPTNIPAVAELRRSQKQLLEAAHSDEERTKIHRAGNKKTSFLIQQNLETTLQSALSSLQTKGLDELFLQMKGPHAILEDTNVIQELNLSREQTNQMSDVSNSYGQFLSLLRQRFLRLQIQPTRNRDRADLESEIESLVRVIKEVEKDQDAGLLAVLSEEQHRSWNKLCGAPIRIDWKVDYFSSVPFEDKSSHPE
jgi:Spy/CpxP family protein refolding chaperone